MRGLELGFTVEGLGGWVKDDASFGMDFVEVQRASKPKPNPDLDPALIWTSTPTRTLRAFSTHQSYPPRLIHLKLRGLFLVKK